MRAAASPSMPLARRGDAAVAVPSMWGLELVMQQLAVGDGGDNDDEEEDDDDEGPCRLPVVAQSQCLSCRRFSLVAGVGCLYCEGDNTDDDSFSYEDWEACSEPEEEQLLRATPVTFCGFKKSFLCDPSSPLRPAGGSQDCSQLGFALPQKHQLTAEEAERNAEELVAEEERVKKKAEKKRLKKKRQKDRKRQEKRNQESEAGSQAQPAASSDKKRGGPLTDVANVLRRRPSESEGGSSPGPSETLASPGCSSEEEEEPEEELDLTSTFVSKARLKVSSKPPLRKEKAERGKPAQPEKPEHQVLRPGLQKTPEEQSMVLADCGNETAKCGRYWEAVLLFTEAVKLNPREYRFFGNRSFCYEKLQRYPEALHDARLALHLQPGWPKGLFRQGKALMGLKQYADAARTFQELLQVDGFRGDAATQLHRCHVQLVLRNNFVPCAAVPPGWGGLAPAAPLPLPGGRPLASCGPQVGGPLASFSITNSKYPVEVSAAPTSVREWFAVWVGNLTPKITQEVLLRHFQPFGPIDSIRCLPQKFCAFVNYTSREAAEAAYVALQGADLAGRKLQLQLKHPVHATPPVAKASSGSQLPVKREPAPPPTACGCPTPNANCAKGGGCSLRRLPQRGATATKLQQS